MNDEAMESETRAETYDYSTDFRILTSTEKRRVIKTAKTFLKLLKENAAPANAPLSKNQSEKKA